MQIIADATGLPVQRSRDVELAAVGAAIFAMKAAGLCESLIEGQVRFRSTTSVFAPQPTPQHDELAQDYASLRDAHLRSPKAG